MVYFARFVKRPKNLTIIIIFLLILLIIIIIEQNTYISYEFSPTPPSNLTPTSRSTLTPTPPSNLTLYDKFCWVFARQNLLERSFGTSHNVTSRNESIPYSYSYWKSSSIMPRRLTSCEHAILIRLLSILIKDVFDKHNIPYMMIAGTLLGSYTHHDIMPWDDDIDLSVAIRDRYRLQSIIRSNLSLPYSMMIMPINNVRNYDKVCFTWCPHAGGLPWRFPFIDIAYHAENSTHVWLIGHANNCPVRRQDVFPLVFRPLGPLWLLAPQQPIAYFESASMIHTGCIASAYSHRYERLLYNATIYVNCEDLKLVYSNVERQCTSTECVEYLKLNDKILHMITFTPAYRTFYYAEKNSSYKAC